MSVAQPYRDAAMEYCDAGWNPLPLLGARGSKGTVPKGFTGYQGADVTRSDVRRWIRSNGGSNVALRVPRNVIGLDLDNYASFTGEPDHKGRRDVRHPAGTASASLAALEAEHGPLPATLRVSSRFGDDYDGVSGTRFYRLPEEYADLADQKVWRSGWGAIDIVRWGHRQQVVWPSVHDSGRTYRYLDEETGEVVADVLPSVDELPLLPETWCSALLRRRGPGGRALDLGDLLTEGEQCRAVRQAMERVMSDSQSGRHGAMLRGTARLVRLGEQGHEGVGQAMSELRSAYISAVGGERDGAGEFDRAAEGAADLVSYDPTAEEDRGCCPKVRKGLLLWP